MAKETNKRPAKIADVLNTLPKRELAHYAHGEWAKLIPVPEATRVVTALTLDEVFEAQRTGAELPVTVVISYRLSMLGDSNGWNESDTSLYVNEDEQGLKSVAIKFEEIHKELKLRINQVQSFQPSDARPHQDVPPSVDRWVAKGYTTGYHEYNYNAGGEWYNSHYVLTCEKGVITWEYIDKKN